MPEMIYKSIANLFVLSLYKIKFNVIFYYIIICLKSLTFFNGLKILVLNWLYTSQDFQATDTETLMHWLKITIIHTYNINFTHQEVNINNKMLLFIMVYLANFLGDPNKNRSSVPLVRSKRGPNGAVLWMGPCKLRSRIIASMAL